MVAIQVGGIAAQVKDDIGLPVTYSKEDVDASLLMYNELPDEPDAAFLRSLYASIEARATVRAVRDNIGKAFTMAPDDLAQKSARQVAHIMDNFTTHSNVANIISCVHKALNL
mmetsp:Transcript_52145/g.113325  ORF Transcript_52145/g.113325 Transcript_52145/m.113325 type:complete len:113 (+) Transcript_52145:3-341(+)